MNDSQMFSWNNSRFIGIWNGVENIFNSQRIIQFKIIWNLKTKMEFLFGKKKTPAQMLRENQRLLTRAMRDLDRERASLEKQEKKIIADIKGVNYNQIESYYLSLFA